MKPARLLTAVSLGAALAWLTGCQTFQHPMLTKKLWTDADLSEFNEPASPPQVKAFQASPAARFLITYDEYRERNGSTRRRAFYLPDNAAALASQVKPSFTNPTPGSGAVALPVVGASDPPPSARLYLRLSPDQKSISLVRDGEAQGPYRLPTYDDGTGTPVRVIITPFALVGDAVVFGSMLGVCWLWVLAHTPYGWP